MADIHAINNLMQSWNKAALELGVQPASPPSHSLVQKLYLVTKDNQLTFEKKPERSLLERIIRFLLGEPKYDCFSAHLAKIKELYAVGNEPLPEEAEILARFEERINALGRYVFSKRKEKTLFCFSEPTLSNYQLRALSSTNELIKPELIKRNLPNPSFKLCWLNAAVKFMAATTLYDSLLTMPSDDKTLEPLREALFHMVEALRKNWPQPVVVALQQELITTLEASPLKDFVENLQEDADDFLLKLNNFFATMAREKVEVIRTYSSFDEAVCKPGKVTTELRLQIHANSNDSINLEETFRRPETMRDVTEYMFRSGGALIPSDASHDALEFGYRDSVKHYPNLLEINVRRGDYTTHQVKKAKIRFEEGGFITLNEYEEDDRYFIQEITPKTRCKFRAIAAIEQIGTTPESGHYITHIRESNGTITTHDDVSVLRNQPESVWERAYYLVLSCVDRTELRHDR